jgi:colanic acid/amylovoran biosynthesis glycosyltransferase
MRITFVVSEFPSLSETFVIAKYEGLFKLGWDFQIICDRSEGKKRNLYPNSAALFKRTQVNWPGKPLLLVPFFFLLALIECLTMNPGGTLRYIKRALPLMKTGVFRTFYQDARVIASNPDILHFEFGALAAGQIHLKDLLGCAVTVSFRGYDIHFAGIDRENFYGEVWRKADRLHFNSNELRQQALKRGCPADIPFEIIRPAVDVNFFCPPENERDGEGPVRILSVGRLVWKKGYEYALEAIKLLIDQGVQCEYYIAGSGDHLKAVLHARQQFGLEAHVHMLGALRREEVREQLAKADVFLHPSLTEGFSNVILEAQAMRLPIVCTDVGDAHVSVEERVTGFILPCREPKMMAEKLALLASDGELRRKMGRAARERAIRLFNQEQQIRNHDRFYRAVAEKR